MSLGVVPQSNLDALQQRGGLLGGVWHFYQPTKALARPNGQLRFGDKWYNTADGTQWYWDGTYWRGRRNTISLFANNVNAQTDLTFPIIQMFEYPLILSRVSIRWLDYTNDGSNYWQISASNESNLTGGQATFAVPVLLVPSTAGVVSGSGRNTLVLLQNFTSSGMIHAQVNNRTTHLVFRLARVGTPGNLTAMMAVTTQPIFL